MIFEVGLSPDRCLRLDSDILFEVMSELIRAHRLGKHLVILPRATGEWLMANLPFGTKEAATLRRLMNEYTQTGGLLASAPVRAKLVEGLQGPPVLRGREILVDIERVALPKSFEETSLIVEDLPVDAAVFRIIFDVLSKKFEISNYNFSIIHGGGERVVEVFESELNSYSIVCVIVDSDKIAPMSGDSLKVRKTKRLLLDRGWALSEVFVLPCRELENLIDRSVVALLPNGVSAPELMAKLTRIATAEELQGCDQRECFWLFCDLRDGLSKEGLENLAEGPAKQWIVSRLTLDGPIEPIAGFGRLADSLLESGVAIGTMREVVNSKRFTSVFGSFFEKILWYGVAPRPQFT